LGSVWWIYRCQSWFNDCLKAFFVTLRIFPRHRFLAEFCQKDNAGHLPLSEPRAVSTTDLNVDPSVSQPNLKTNQ
jgi:hypothetical protein